MAIPRPMVGIVIDRDGGRCVLALNKTCVGTATTADHRANRGRGGSKVLDDPRNLIAACSLCNGRKETVHGAELKALIDRGVRVRKAATNAQTLDRVALVPVQYPDGRWFLLLPDGRRQESTDPEF